MELPAALTVDNTILVVVDIQDKLYRVMHEKERLLQNLQKLIKGAVVLEVPVILTVQYPKGLGATLPEIIEVLPDVKPIEKIYFSCWGEELFRKELEKVNRPQVLIAGIESHVCVYQTTMDLLSNGYGVHLVADCVSSRGLENKEVSLSKMSGAGVNLTTTEIALFEMLKVARGDKFKQISSIVK